MVILIVNYSSWDAILQVFHSAARDLVKAALRHKAWGTSQLMRLRRLNNAARQVAADKKTFDQEVGMMMRRTNNLSLTFLCGEKREVRTKVMQMQKQLKQLVKSMDTFITEGRKVQFRFQTMRGRRNRKLLNLPDAMEAHANGMVAWRRDSDVGDRRRA